MTEQDKLLYFNSRGRCEAIRMLYILGGEDFTNELITNEEWHKRKPDGRLLALGQLPVLTTKHGAVLCQSNVIARYVAKKSDLMGSNLMEETLHDLVVEVAMEFLNDIQQNIYKYTIYGTPAPENFDSLKAEVKDRITKRLLYIQSIGDKQGRKFIVCDKMGLADVWLYACLEMCRVAFPDIMEFTSWTKEFTTKFTSNEIMKKHLAERPPSYFHGL